MPVFRIIEVDRDYRVQSGSELREFPDLLAAEAHCRAESWTGYDYYVDRTLPSRDDEVRDPGVCRAG